MSARITVAASRTQFPLRGDGGVRTAGLYAALARQGMEVEVVALAPWESRGGRFELAHGLTEIRVPRSGLQAHVERTYRMRPHGLDPDELLATQQRLTPVFLDALAESARDAALVIGAGAAGTAVAATWTGAPLVLDARDGRPAGGRPVRTALRLAASERQADWIVARHRVRHAAIAVVPDGVAPDPPAYVDPPQRAARAAALGLRERPSVVVFARAVSAELEAAARVLRHVRFFVFDTDPDARGEFAPLELDRAANIERVTGGDQRRLEAALAVAAAAVREEPEIPRAAPELLLAAQAGAPLLAGATARDLGLAAAALAPGDLAGSLAALLCEDAAAVAARVAASRAAVQGRTWDEAARSLLADARVAGLLEASGGPLRRRRRGAGRVLA